MNAAKKLYKLLYALTQKGVNVEEFQNSIQEAFPGVTNAQSAHDNEVIMRLINLAGEGDAFQIKAALIGSSKYGIRTLNCVGVIAKGDFASSFKNMLAEGEIDDGVTIVSDGSSMEIKRFSR